MIRFYLGEEPLLPSVRGYDLGDPEQLERALPRSGRSRDQAAIRVRRSGRPDRAARDAPRELEAAIERVREQPHRFVAQEPVALSVHPTVDRRTVSRTVTSTCDRSSSPTVKS